MNKKNVYVGLFLFISAMGQSSCLFAQQDDAAGYVHKKKTAKASREQLIEQYVATLEDVVSGLNQEIVQLVACQERVLAELKALAHDDQSIAGAAATSELTALRAQVQQIKEQSARRSKEIEHSFCDEKL